MASAGTRSEWRASTVGCSCSALFPSTRAIGIPIRVRFVAVRRKDGDRRPIRTAVPTRAGYIRVCGMVDLDDQIGAQAGADLLGPVQRNTVSLNQKRYPDMSGPVLDVGHVHGHEFARWFSWWSGRRAAAVVQLCWLSAGVGTHWRCGVCRRERGVMARVGMVGCMAVRGARTVV